MATYAINFVTTASMFVEVEAEDFDEAIDKAYEQMPSTGFAQDPFDLSDWEIEPENCYRDGEPVR